MKGLFADFVINNGTIITVDNEDTMAEAVAVRDGIIVNVGTDKDMKPLVGENTKVMNLNGKTIVPGFIDSHTHNTHLAEFRYSFELLN